MALKRSVGRLISAANQKADLLTAGAKAVLCIPSMLSGLPDLGKGIVSSILSNIGKTLENFASTVSGIVTNTINGAVSQITGSIVGVINTVTQTLGQIGSAIEAGKEFAQGLKDRVNDIKDFTSEKENCNFAAATLLNCIAAQAIGSVSAKASIDLAKGLKPIADFANDVSKSIAAPGGAITRTVDKAASQIDRATRIVEKSNIF
jgi:phage-related protein